MAKKGSQFTTYHPDFKLQVVEDYLSGKSGGLNLIARKYGLKSKSQVENWVKKVSQKSKSSETRFTRKIIYQSSKVCQTRRHDTRGTK
ncbi:transposase [Streptococcus sanguinis]|jgi:transposase|uniref:Transposase n=1 Tax=Streptococcus sanguinis TaxID=1305 RepID=A0AAE8G169_STRSA|nr:transposase [Streptococcus sanguinis]RSI09787.1 Transposase [Streptococcus sanguinis]RSI19693.1 Transposase [Streptococcus sanguinis]